MNQNTETQESRTQALRFMTLTKTESLSFIHLGTSKIGLGTKQQHKNQKKE